MRQKISVLLLCFFAIFLGVYAGQNFDSLFAALTNKSISDNIFYSAFDDNYYYSVVNSRSKIVVLDKSGVCVNTIIPNGEFAACINGVLPDTANGQLYIWSTYYDETGSYIALEEILLYSADGKFENILYSKEYTGDDAVPVSGRIHGLTVFNDGSLGAAVVDKDSITTIEIDNRTGDILDMESFTCENASHMVFDVYLDGSISDFYFSTKQGKILKSVKGALEAEIVFDAGEENIFVPSKIYVRPDKSILLKESFNSAIVIISPEGGKKTLLSAADKGLDEITSFYICDDSLLISDNYQIQQYSIENGELVNINAIDKLRYGMWDYAKSYIVFVLIIFTIGCIFYIAGKMIQRLTTDNKQIFRQTIIICLSLSVTVGIISFYIFKALDDRTLEANYNLLTIHLEYLSSIIDSERVENINSSSQFGSEDFNVIVDQLNQALTVKGEQDHSKYVGILKNFDGKIVIITYQDMDEFFFTPLFSEYQLNGIYLQAFEEGKVVRALSNDAEGRWQYVFGPIYNDAGEIISVVEIGLDLTPYEEANNTLFTDLLLKLVSILVTIMLLFTEYTIYESKVINKQSKPIKTEDDIQSIASGSVRVFSVLLFTGTYLNSTFMPVYSNNLYINIFDLPRDIVIALPIVMESLFLIISILGFSKFRKKVDFKLAILAGGVLYALGNIFTALSVNTLNLIVSRAVVGVGYGIVYIALRAYIAGSNSELSKEELIAYGAGMTCGVSAGGILGSIIADFVGFRNTFFAVAVIMLAASITAWRILDSRYSTIHNNDSKKVSGIKFFLNKDVIIYYIFEFLPAAVCGSFLLYFLPLIAARLDYSTAFVGQVFLLNALFTIYSGPVLVRITSKRFGIQKSLVIAGLMFAGAIFLVAFNASSMAVVALTAIIIGVVSSFKETQESNYFFDLNICNEVGETKAVSYFGLFECTGELAGPIIYAFILSIGTSQGLIILGVVLVVTITIFGLTSQKM